MSEGRYVIKKKRAGKRAAESDSIAATDAAKNFGQLANRVHEGRATYMIERHGRPIAQIGPVVETKRATLRDIAEYIRSAPRLDELALRSVEEGVNALNTPAVPQNPWER
jgi:antitoxin (DNA-binding transcriptional repressor) of toxin-antitoxin stability system